jgi:hypothetical protein
VLPEEIAEFLLEIDIGAEDAIRVSLALVLPPFLDIPFLLLIVPSPLGFSNQPHPSIRNGLPEEIVSILAITGSARRSVLVILSEMLMLFSDMVSLVAGSSTLIVSAELVC